MAVSRRRAARAPGCAFASSHAPRTPHTHTNTQNTHKHTKHTPNPGRAQPIHWGYYSCNGFSPDTPPGDVAGLWGGIDPLWRDVLARHEAAPMHFMARRGFSCVEGGLRGLWGGVDPLWRGVPARLLCAHTPCFSHDPLPQVGGGDQLYNDDVMKSPGLGPFLEAPEDARPGWEFGAEMKDDVRGAGGGGVHGVRGVCV